VTSTAASLVVGATIVVPKVVGAAKVSWLT